MKTRTKRHLLRSLPLILSLYFAFDCSTGVGRRPPVPPIEEGESLSEEERRLQEEEPPRTEEEKRRRVEALELERQEEERRHAEEEERRREREERHREEERRRAEAEELERQKRKAGVIRQRFRWQEEEYQDALERHLNLEREQEREERLRREDPDRHAFWRREQEGSLGRDLVFTVASGVRAVLFRNGEPLQFHGFGAFFESYRPTVSSGFLLEGSLVELTPLLLREKGDYVVLTVGESALEDGRELDLGRTRYQLLRTRINNETYRLINIYSDGESVLRIEMERDTGEEKPDEYFVWSVDNLYLSQM